MSEVPEITPSKKRSAEVASEQEKSSWEVANIWLALNVRIKDREEELRKLRDRRDRVLQKFPYLGQIKGILNKEERKKEEESEEEEEGEKQETPKKKKKTSVSSESPAKEKKSPGSAVKRLEQKMKDVRENKPGHQKDLMMVTTQDFDKKSDIT